METINITPTQLRKAADIQEKIQSLQQKLGQLLGGPAESAVAVAPQGPKKRKISAAGIARIVAATKSRWAKIKAANGEAKPAQKQKGKMSAQGLANIRAAQKTRWAKIKGTSSTTAAPKKKLSAQGIANIRAGVAKRMAAQGKAVHQPKIQRSAAWRAAVSAAAKARWAKAKRARKSSW